MMDYRDIAMSSRGTDWRRALFVRAVAIAMLTLLTLGLAPAAANALGAAPAGVSDLQPEAPFGPQADARPCNRNDRPAQIRLVLAPGAVICYGGTVGSVRVDDIWATGLASGGYTGFVTCTDLRQEFFEPNEFVRLDCHVMWIGIIPALSGQVRSTLREQEEGVETLAGPLSP